MTREQAEERARRLTAEHPDRRTHRWVAREMGDGGWEVVKLAVPSTGPTHPEVLAAERPPQPDDPRPAQQRNVPWPY